MSRRRRKNAPVTLGQGHDLILIQRGGKHREVVYHTPQTVVARRITTDVEPVDVARQWTDVISVVEELTINPDLLHILVLDEDVVVPRVEHLFTPSTNIGGIRVDPLCDSITATGRVPVNLAVAPRHVGLHRPTRLRPEA